VSATDRTGADAVDERVGDAAADAPAEPAPSPDDPAGGESPTGPSR